jgi:hypothetical protein
MLAEIGREEFVREVWDCRPGQHVIAVAPTGGGKSHLLYSLLEQTMAQYPDLSVVSFMPKPADPAVAEWGQRLDLRETPVWPPRKKLFQGKPAGHLLWPPHPLNLPPDQRRAYVGDVLRTGLDEQYKRGYSISFVDDATSSAGLMGLNTYLEELLTNGRAGGAAAWVSAQKPAGTRSSAGVTTLVWGNATHLFLGKTPSDSDIERYTEISGLPPKLVDRTIRELQMVQIGDTAVTQFLYVNKAGPFAAIVNP